jgi:hypothetical protein
MAIVKSIEKYLDYYNKYLAQSMTIMEKTSELLRKQEANKLTSEAIKSMDTVANEKDLYNIQKTILQKAYASNLPEVAENIKQPAAIKLGEIKETAALNQAEEQYKNINPDEFRIVNGQLKTVGEIVKDVNLSNPADILKLINTYKKPDESRGINIINKDLALVRSYVDPDTKEVLQSKTYPVKNINGEYVYVDDKNANKKIDENEIYALLPNEANYIFEADMRKKEFQLRARQQQLYEQQREKELKLGEIQQEFKIAEDYDKMMSDYYVHYKINFDPEISKKYNEADFNVKSKIREDLAKEYFQSGGALNSKELGEIFDKIPDSRNVYESKKDALKRANLKTALYNSPENLPQFKKNFNWYDDQVYNKVLEVGFNNLEKYGFTKEEKSQIEQMLSDPEKSKELYPSLYIKTIEYLSKKFKINKGK